MKTTVLDPLTRLIANTVRHRRLLFALTRQKLVERYAGTVGGLLWAILKPLLTLLVFWFVFSVGFKAEIQSGYPFIVYFLPSYAAWLFFSEAISSSVFAISSNAHLVRKMVFPIEVLPAAALLAAAIPHVILVVTTCIVAWLHGYRLNSSFLLLPYAFCAMVALCLGLAWLISSLQVFFRDVAHVVESILQIWFWMTPIVWPPSMIPPQLNWILYLNPMHHISSLYRDALTGSAPKLQSAEVIAFWIATGLCAFAGAYVFRRLKPEFSDVV